MTDVSDQQLRALLNGDLPEEEERRIGDLVAGSPELQARLGALSGATAFDRDFDTAHRRASSPSTAPGGPLETAYRGLLDPPEDPETLGKLGPYLVLEHIATGGMGILFKARDPELDRLVALKILSPALAASDDARRRFLVEAKAVAALDHPNIVPIHAIDSDANPPYLVMRYIEGQSLQERLDEADGQPLPFDELIQVAGAMASALEAAHRPRSLSSSQTESALAQGVIHRDIKPSNILLEECRMQNAEYGSESDRKSPAEGSRLPPASGIPYSVFLTDFGLARPLEPGSTDLGLTRTGQFLGTPKYMSPEQAAGARDLDHRTDLFSLGAVLYTAATGRAPFEGESFQKLAHEITETAPARPRDLNRELPTWFANLVMRLLAKNPADRPDSAAEVLATIEDKVNLGTLSFTRLVGRRTRLRHRLKRGLAFTAIAVLATIGALFVTERTGHTAIVNTVLAIRHGHEAFLAGKRGTFAGLENAIEAAEPGDTIVLRTNEVIRLTKYNVIPEGKSLTIRAARGFRPVIEDFETSGRIYTKSPLTLRGLTLVQPSTSNDLLYIIRCDKSPLEFANCRFYRPVLDSRRMKSPSNGIIWAVDCPRITIRDCEVLALGSSFLAAENLDDPGQNDRSSIRIENSVFVASALWLRQRHPEKHFDIDIERSELGSIDVVRVDEKFLPGTVSIRANQSVFIPSHRLLRHPWPDAATLREHLDWSGDENVFATHNPLLSFAKHPFDIDSLEEWRGLWSEKEPVPDQASLLTNRFHSGTSANPGEYAATTGIYSAIPPPGYREALLPGFPRAGPRLSRIGPPGRRAAPARASPPASSPSPVVLERTGRTFDSLQDALDASEPGDTLVLEGEDPIEAPCFLLPAHPLTLRAAPGHRPSLLATNADLPLLVARAPLTLEGLTLARPRRHFPAALIHVDGTSLTLRNCLLYRHLVPSGPAGPSKFGVLILCTNASRIDVERSILLGIDLVTFRLQFPPGSESDTTSIRLSNSLSLSNHSFRIHPGPPSSELQITLERSALLTARPFRLPEHPEHAPRMAVGARDTVIDAIRFLSVSGWSLDQLRASFSWAGTQNHYRLAHGFQVLEDQPRSAVNPAQARHLDVLRKLLDTAELDSTSLPSDDNLSIDDRNTLLEAAFDGDLETFRSLLAARAYPPGIGPDPALLGPR